MIGTVDTKAMQLRDGFWSSGSGPEKILLMGSCRSIAYLNYLFRFNETVNRFTIRFIDPFNLHWDERDNIVDLEQNITACEKDSRILDILSDTDIFLHEWYAYFGIFSTDRNKPKTIYDFGMKPRLDICIPNFHDHFVLFQEQIDVNAGGCVNQIKLRGIEAVAAEMRQYGFATLEKFYEICRKSSFPEMAEHFRMNWPHVRYFWTSNHISANFSLYVFRQMNDRFLNLPLTGEFWSEACREDQFSTPCTRVTCFDQEAYGLTWNSPVEELKLP